MDDSTEILTSDMKKYVSFFIYLQLRGALPEILQYQTWTQLFDISKDGVSYLTFFKKLAGHPMTLVLIQDTNNNVFGIYASQVWRDCKDFYGTGESFVFTFKVNNYF